MADASLVFPAEEYRGRTERLQAEMATHGLEALLLTTPPDVFYVTGFLTRFWESPARPWFVIVPAQGAPVAVIPSIGLALMQETWISDIRTWDAPNPANSGVDLLADTLRGTVGARGRIGVPSGPETHVRMPLTDLMALQEAIRPREISDATACLHHVREIKSAAEVEKLRAICQIAGHAFEKVPEFARAGARLDRVFRDFQIACLVAGADWVSYLAGAAGQGGYADVISPAGPQPLVSGDLLMLDCGAVAEGYFCDFDRNFSIGEADRAVAKAHAALWDATEEALATIRPGMRASDVHALLGRALESRGARPAEGRFGHGLGISLTEWPSLSAHDHTVLRAGMALTLEPCARLGPDRIIVHEECLWLTEEGAQLLSPRAPRSLPVIKS